MPSDLLINLILAYAVALILVVAGGRIGLPPVIALIASGMLAGPQAFGIVATAEEVDQLADIGVALLLFTVGLEFPLRAMRRLWTTVLGAGSAQVAATAALVGAIAMLSGVNANAAIFTGFFVALSSTAIVLNEFGRRNRLDSPAGRLTTGILLFQDLCVVVLLLLAPMLAGGVDSGAVPRVLGRGLLALAAIAVISRIVVPVLFRLVTACRQREAFPLAVLVASVGTAALAAGLGLSMALGAFLAGLMLAGSEFSDQAHAEVRPLRDLLSSVFFISLGMLLDPMAAVRNLPLVLAVCVGMLTLKAIVGAVSVALSGISFRVAVVCGLYLAQVGEFSFVLGRDALELGVLTPQLWDILLPASIVTMIVTPPLVKVAPDAAEWIAKRWGKPAEAVAAVTAVKPVLILGFGIGGQLVANALKEFGVPYHILDLNGATVRQARAQGEPISYGDGTSPDTLMAVGLDRAQAVVLVLSDPDASLKIVRAIRRLAPGVPIFVRTRYRAEAARMQEAGATAVAEELEASLEVLAQLLVRLDFPGNVIEVLLDGYRRREGLRALRSGAPQLSLDTLASEILEAPIASHQVQPDDAAQGRTLADLRLRTDTGVSVLAVKRDGQFITSPASDLQLRSGDVLYLLGGEPDVRRARGLLGRPGSETR